MLAGAFLCLPSWADSRTPVQAPHSRLTVVPVVMTGGRSLPAPWPKHCQIFISDNHDLRSSPCGAPVGIPAGHLAVWVEGDGVISRTVAELDHDGRSDRTVVSQLVAAVRIVPETKDLAPTDSVWILEATAFREFETFRRLLFPAELGKEVQVPRAQFVLVARDRRDDVAALSGVFSAHNEARAVLTAPRSAAHAVALIDDSAVPNTEAAFFVLERSETSRPPEITARAGAGIWLAGWLGLDSGIARVDVRSSRLMMRPTSVAVQRSGVATVRTVVTMKPTLTVDVRMSEAAASAIKEKSPQIRLVAEGTGHVIAERAFDRAGAQTFPYMPAQLLDVEIRIGSWKIVERADLTSGDDVTTAIELDPIHVSGVVYYGSDRAASRIQFRRSDAKLNVETNDAGEYEALLWEGGATVAEVWLRDRPDLPSHRELVHVVDGTNELDFRIPRTRYRISITDSDSGKPIRGSTATLINRWNDPREGQRSASRTVTTNDAGIADLPPLYAGVVELHAQADGYFEAESIRFNVADGDEAEHTVAVRLRAEGNRRSVHLLLPSGAPASGAQLISVNPETMGFLWGGRADAEGVVSIPESLDASLLLGRHPNGGALVWRWHRADPSSSQLRFPASAAPLVVRFTRHDGTPARFAGVTLWIGGVVIREGALAFLTDSDMSDTDGIWLAPNLPAGPVMVAGASGPSRSSAGLQVLRGFATEIAFPWPASVAVRAME